MKITSIYFTIKLCKILILKHGSGVLNLKQYDLKEGKINFDIMILNLEIV